MRHLMQSFLFACVLAVPGVLVVTSAFAQAPADARSPPTSSQRSDIDLLTYRVGPEDLLEISVWREDTLKKEALVRPTAASLSAGW